MPLMVTVMSDIAIRFDGLLLATTLALAALMYLVVALAAATVWLSTGRSRRRASRVARKAGLFSLPYLAALYFVAARLVTSAPPVTGIDWLDWLSLPSLILFLIGCVAIARR